MLRPCLAAALMLATTLATSRAVIVAGGDGTQNTTAPSGGNDFGFANVAQVFDTSDTVFASGVYLGNGWVITAYHVVRDGADTGFLFGDVILAGNTFSVEAATAVRLTTGGTPADIVVMHLAGTPPNLPSVTLSASTPAAGSSLSMAGNGRNRDTNVTNWQDSGGTWIEVTSGGNRQGYKYAAGATLRWGTNNRTSNNVFSLDDGHGVTSAFLTSFDSSAGTGEAQAAPGDSGGGVFFKRGATWELSGIMLATGQLANQPGDTAVFGDQTFIADIASYRSQIVSIIPEPSSALLLGVAGGALVVRRRRHHESRR